MPANDVVANLVGLRHLQDWIEAHRIPMVSIHTSGHASVSDLKRLVAAVDPRHLIPIHTFEREAYAERFGRATVLDDGEWFSLVEGRSEEHTSELQSLMRISYAVFCLKKKKITDR